MLETMRRPIAPITADDRGLVPSLLRCPLCGNRLSQDLWWKSLHWLCPLGHSYSNVRALIAELRERGWLPESFSLDAMPDSAEALELRRAVRESERE